MPDISSDSVIILPKNKSNYWLYGILGISLILLFSFLIWTKLGCPGMEKVLGLRSDISLPNIPLQTTPENFYNKHPEPIGTKVLSGTVHSYQYDKNTNVLYIKVKAPNNYVWLLPLKQNKLIRVITIHEEESERKSGLVNNRDAYAWINKNIDKNIGITAGIRNSIIEDVIVITPLVD